MKNKRLWILVGGILLIVAAFLLLNFRLAASNTQAMRKVVTTTLEGDMPESNQQPAKISLVLVGEGPMVRALQKTLTQKLDNVGLGEIEVVDELKPTYQTPILVVKVISSRSFWTPLFGISQLSIHAGYASNGDSTFMEVIEATQTSIGNPDHSVLNMYAEYDVDDRSLGMISRPGYHQYLADFTAQEILDALKQLYKM
jgi:hypothetical protein